MESVQKSFKCIKVTKNATLPTRATPQSAGLDLCSAEELYIYPKQRAVVKTDLVMRIPHNHFGRVTSKSGLSHQYQVDVITGIIDEDYRGNVRILLHNHGKDVYLVQKGYPIAQLIIEPIQYYAVEEVDYLAPTSRGPKGFGSTNPNLN